MKLVESDQENLVGKLKSQNFEFSPTRWKQGSGCSDLIFLKVTLDLVIIFCFPCFTSWYDLYFHN